MMISGMKMSVAQSMMFSVSWLDTLSQTVRLERRSVDDGMTKGNSETPAVPMTPTMASDEATKATSVRPFVASSMALRVPR